MTEGIVDCEQQGFQQRFDHVDNLEYEEALYGTLKIFCKYIAFFIIIIFRVL